MADTPSPEPLLNERRIVLLLGLVQFVNILDFMMVMPLGPDFSRALGIPVAQVGTLGAAYTAAAALSGFAGGFFLDRFDRRSALTVSLIGLSLGTVSGALAWDFPSLIAARVLAGIFGGPATSLSLAIVADVIPAERRGKALSQVMTAFSIASVLGVPVGLELARVGGWAFPFWAVGGLGGIATLGSALLLPPLRLHLARGAAPPGRAMFALLARSLVQRSYLLTACIMAAGFLLIPNISAFVQFNMGYPREKLGLLYLFGGIASFLCLQAAGRLVDRFGSFRVGSVGTLALTPVVFFGFVEPHHWLSPPAIFVFFMIATAFRNVAYSTLNSKVPSPSERAGFMSLQSAVQHLATAGAAEVSTLLLTTTPTNALVGMDRLGWLSMALSVAVVPLLWSVQRSVLTPPARQPL